MVRPLLSLWRCLLPVALPVPVLAAAVAFDLYPSRFLWVAGAAVLVGQVRSRSVWRLAAGVCRFHTLADERVTLHYHPTAAQWYDLPALIRRTTADLDRLAGWFGRPLHGRPAVYLMAAPADVARACGLSCGAAALFEPRAILVGAGSPLREEVRHELAHLFADRWNRHAPPLLAEGLAVWLQGTEQGEPIDTAAWPWVGEPGLGLPALLSSRFFHAEPHRYACYVLAGSFTGFLLRRYGKAAYRRLYRRARRWGFDRTFRRCLGVEFAEAERQWRYEALAVGPLGRPAGPEESPWAVTGP